MLGQGTEFRVVLTYPLATNEQIALNQRRNLPYSDKTLSGKCVLLAEDTRINAEVIIKMLDRKGIHVELARDGQEAVELFRKQGPYHYQAILMDIMMPVKNGLEAAREIRNTVSIDAKTIPIIALTADVQAETESRCLDAGMNAYLCKPIDPDRLFDALYIELTRVREDRLIEKLFHPDE